LSLASLESLVYNVYEWPSQFWWSIYLCLSLYGWASTVLKNIRLGCKGSPGTNTLAYFPKLQNRDKRFGLLKACYDMRGWALTLLEHIDSMLIRIIDATLKQVAHKCQWVYDASQPMEWVGFTLENNLLKPQESKVKSIKEFPIPTTAKQVISFESLASFYRRFIKYFARIAKPMHELTGNRKSIIAKVMRE
jgi:hypothetical protein